MLLSTSYRNLIVISTHIDLQHYLWSLRLDGKLGLSPACQKEARPGRVLDVGTGTGAWSYDFGEEHPEAIVIGTDLSPIQPQS